MAASIIACSAFAQDKCLADAVVDNSSHGTENHQYCRCSGRCAQHAEILYSCYIRS